MDESLTKIRHERSKKDFPGLGLDDDEYVEFAFRRAPVCLFLILGGTFFALVAILLAFLLILIGQSMLDSMGKNFIYIILGALLVATILVALIAIIIYHGNKLFVTNKHVIQKTMISPVAHSVNIIDLVSVEDVSFNQSGILAMLFHYGTLRLATTGDETSYTFKYSNISAEDLKAVTKMVSDAKGERKDKK